MIPKYFFGKLKELLEKSKKILQFILRNIVKKRPGALCRYLSMP